MFERRSKHKELLDHLPNDHDALEKNLDEMEKINRWFGSKRLIIHFMNKISDQYFDVFKNNKIVIADFGCGNGDILRSIDQWSRKNDFNLELIGFDINPSVIKCAVEKSTSHPNIQYRTADMRSEKHYQNQFDIILINSVCHHFHDAVLIKLFRQLARQARLAVLINDLHRHWISYFSIKCMLKMFNFSYLAQNDGPLSVLKAFRKHELIYLLSKANITHFQLRWVWAFRWKIIIWCSKDYYDHKN